MTLDYVNLGVKIALGCLGVIALIFGAATIVRMLTESKTKEIADLAGGAASASLQGVLNNKEGLTVIQQAFDKIPEMAFTISQGIRSILMKILNKHLSK